MYASPNITRVIKSRRIIWAGLVARVREMRNVYKIRVGYPEGKRQLGKIMRRWEDNIRMDLKEIRWEGVGWIHLRQDRGPVARSCGHGKELPGFL